MRGKELLAIAVCVLAACGGGSMGGSMGGGDTELETVDVAAAPDAAVSTEFDEQARQPPAQEMAGVLPSSFPAGMLVFSPASVVDFGDLPGEREFVVLDTSAGVSQVRLTFGNRVATSGWLVEPLDGDGYAFSRGGQRVLVNLEDLGAGTRIRYEYEPGV